MTADRRTRVASVIALAMTLQTCSRSNPDAGDRSPVVARWKTGSVTAEQIDQAILELPPPQRRPADGDYLAWYEAIARELAFNRILATEVAPRQPGAVTKDELAEARRQAIVDTFVSRLRPSHPSDGEIEKFFREHRDDFGVPQARWVRTYFRRVRPDLNAEQATVEVAAVRSRVVAGGSFAQIASESSDSESRARGGAMGWVRRGEQAADLDRLLFELPIGEPSQPVRSRHGVHLFVVEREQPARRFELSEVRRIIAARLASARLEAEFESRVAGEPSASDSMLTGEALAAAIDAGVPSAVLASAGEERLTLRSLESMLALAASRGGAVTPEALVRAFRLRALAYRRAVAEGLADDPVVEERMARVAERLGTARQIRERLATAVRADEGRLEQYFLAHRARFADPRRLDVERLTLPLNENATEAMADLQGLDVNSDAQWRGVAERWGGSIRPLGWLTTEEMARIAPQGAVAGLAASGKTMPFRTETTLELFRVVGRREPEPALFPAARERALDAYLADHGPEEYRRQQESALQGAGFTVDRPALEAMVLRPDATSGNR